MKTLLIIRHAKSSWSDNSQKDFDRPLNTRGHHDAPLMAKRLLDKKIKIDAFISSPAKRAISTCEYFASAFGQKNKDIIQISKLYEANVPTFFEAIKNLNDSLNCVAIFSHNPGITAFVNELTGMQIADMPTCAIFAVNIKTRSWSSFQDAKKDFWFFDYPKNE